MKRAEAKRQEGDQVEGPARPTAMHRQDRPLFDAQSGREIVGKRGFSNETQWQRFLRLNQHVCNDLCTDKRATDIEIERSLDRRDAGNDFANAWSERTPGTRDSLDPRPRGGGTSDGLTVAMIDAGKRLSCWEYRMGQNDWMLVRRVCGEDYPVAQAVVEISPAYRHTALVRFREALDALHAAGKQADKCQWCRAGRPHGSNLETGNGK